MFVRTQLAHTFPRSVRYKPLGAWLLHDEVVRDERRTNMDRGHAERGWDGSKGSAFLIASAQFRSNSPMPLGREGGHITRAVPSLFTMKSRMTVPCFSSRIAL